MQQRNDGIYFIPDTSSVEAHVHGPSNGQRGQDSGVVANPAMAFSSLLGRVLEKVRYSR